MIIFILPMDSRPPTLLKCPRCEAYYKRENWASENTFGATLWSDGVLTDGMTGSEYDPIICCRGCGHFFTPAEGWVKNTWGYSLPKDIKFFGSGSVTVDEALAVLNNEPLLQKIGAAASPKTNVEKAGLSGQFQVRLLIWRRLNDKIRERGYAQLTQVESARLHENTKALIPLIEFGTVDSDQAPILWKAELQRNLGEFRKSITTLVEVHQRSFRGAKRKMILLNLVRNRHLVRLGSSKRGWPNMLTLWRSWVFGPPSSIV